MLNSFNYFGVMICIIFHYVIDNVFVIDRLNIHSDTKRGNTVHKKIHSLGLMMMICQKK